MIHNLSRIAPPDELESTRAGDSKYSHDLDLASARSDAALPENLFHSMLTLERRRAERSRKPFVLMLLDANLENGSAAEILRQAVDVILTSKRETDIIGWYKESVILGVIFAEVNIEGECLVTETLRTKIETLLAKHLGRGKAAKIAISLHVFPESWDRNQSGWVAAPLLAAIAAIIRLTSKGPVIFEQERLGQFGNRFKCLKFRTMFTNNDPKIHQEYIQQFIAGKEECGNNTGSQQPVYKIMNDPRVTPIGGFLRKTSLDELPQFWNVLRGEMSLVGPRPPVPYEFEIYDIWHRRRVLDVKPGVTGLWQVSGRSRTRFDEMVRLDLRYCRTWSLWLDLKILISTPRAVFTGDGAY